MNSIDATDSYPLIEVASISAGYPFRGKIDGLPEGNVAVIQMRNVDPENGIDWPNLSRIDLPRIAPKALLRRGDIILSTRGGRNFAYCLDEPYKQTVCSPHFFVIRSMRPGLLPEFLAWQLNQRPAQEYFAAGATGSYILNLKREVVEGLPIAIPSLGEQQRLLELHAAVRAERSILTRLIEIRTLEMAAIANELLAPITQRKEQRES